MGKLRVLIAEDHDAMRSYMALLLCKDYQVVAAVANGEELVQSALCLLPDVIVSDISMPLMDGPAARSKLISEGKTFPFVFVSVHGKEVLNLLPKEGTVGLVYKGEMSEHLCRALEAVRREGVWLSPFYLGE